MNDQSFPNLNAFQEFGQYQDKFLRSTEALAQIAEADVDVGATPKTLIHAQDKVTLHRYDQLDGVDIQTGPVLIVYGLVGRYTMADLQEDRSLVRNLLGRGVDLYVVDWGHPSQADKYLTLDDYIDWYLDDCVDKICAEAGVDQDHDPRDLRRRRVLDDLRSPAPRQGQEPDPDDHAGRLSCRRKRP